MTHQPTAATATGVPPYFTIHENVTYRGTKCVVRGIDPTSGPLGRRLVTLLTNDLSSPYIIVSEDDPDLHPRTDTGVSRRAHGW